MCVRLVNFVRTALPYGRQFRENETKTRKTKKKSPAKTEFK